MVFSFILLYFVDLFSIFVELAIEEGCYDFSSDVDLISFRIFFCFEDSSSISLMFSLSLLSGLGMVISTASWQNWQIFIHLSSGVSSSFVYLWSRSLVFSMYAFAMFSFRSLLFYFILYNLILNDAFTSLWSVKVSIPLKLLASWGWLMFFFLIMM